MKLHEFDIHNLAFLASLGALGGGCDPGDGSSPAPFGSATVASSSPADSGNPAGTGDGDTGDDAADGNADDAADSNADSQADSADGPVDSGPGGDSQTSGVADTGTGDGFDDGVTGGDAGVLCQSYADLLGGCYGDSPEYTAELAQYCQADLDELNATNPACASAVEEWLACVSMQSCRTLMGEAPVCENVDLSACPVDSGTTGG